MIRPVGYTVQGGRRIREMGRSVERVALRVGDAIDREAVIAGGQRCRLNGISRGKD
jgi:hypothetical protein